MTEKVMTPEWSHRAGRVLESPYWDMDIPENDADVSKELIKALDERNKEFVALRDALQDEDCFSYDDLSADMKKLFNLAEAAANKADRERQEFEASEDYAAGHSRFLDTWSYPRPMAKDVELSVDADGNEHELPKTEPIERPEPRNGTDE